MRDKELHSLRQLARAHGVLIAYQDVAGRRRTASPESLLGVLRALGVPSERDLTDALRHAQEEYWREALPPVAVVWGDDPAAVELRFPAAAAHGRARCYLRAEDGGSRAWDCRLDRLPRTGSARIDGDQYFSGRLALPSPLPSGYHRFELELCGARFETFLVAAPRRMFSPKPTRRRWGVFLPLYALSTEASRGAGDFGDLESLLEWTAQQGGAVVGTLPLLPAFLDDPFEASPYSPVSRRLWNEFYLDLAQLPEMQVCPGARALVGASLFRRRIKTLREGALVDYRRQMALTRQVLQELSRCLYSSDSPRRAELMRFSQKYPHIQDYARFRAAVEQSGRTWPHWPAQMRAGKLASGDYDEAAARCYLYAQWQAHAQMEALARPSQNARLYLDLPLGVHPEGYDTWREQNLFAFDVTGGAPPDPVFTKGQDWGFAPLHPRRLREQGYRYWIEVVRHHLRHAGLLRVDHVMGLHRLYWIPKGFPAGAGAYVNYPAEEFYAILCLESHRHQAVIVGENLGTVPPTVNAALQRHQMRETFVVQYELQPQPRRALRPVPARAVASLNTHDMPPFRAFWEGRDIGDRNELGLLDARHSRTAFRARTRLKHALAAFLKAQGRLKPGNRDAGAVRQACLEHLCASGAELVLVNLEDLWEETEPPNTPGTTTQRVNWRRKARYSLEQFRELSGVREFTQRVPKFRGAQG